MKELTLVLVLPVADRTAAAASGPGHTTAAVRSLLVHTIAVDAGLAGAAGLAVAGLGRSSLVRRVADLLGCDLGFRRSLLDHRNLTL